MGLRLSPLTEGRAEEAATWFVDDPDGQRAFGGFYGTHPKWWDQLKADGDRHAWIAELDDGAPVGFFEIGRGADGVDVHLTFYVRADYRGQGFGTELARAAAAMARALDVPRLVAAIDRANLGSLACCRRAGFVDVGTNSFGECVLVSSATR